MFIRCAASLLTKGRRAVQPTSVLAGMCSTQKKLIEEGTKLKDYEYSHSIQSALQSGDHQRALRLLLQVQLKPIQSHLYDVRLDIQTYCQLADGLIAGNSEPSHLELLYKLYRQHFSPSLLMLKHLTTLRRNADNIFDSRLRADLLYLTDRTQPELRHLLNSFQSQKRSPQIVDKVQAVNLEEVQQQKSGGELEENDLPQSTPDRAGEKRLRLTIDPDLLSSLKEAINGAENVVLHEVTVELNRAPEAQPEVDDWLQVYQKESVQQEAIEHSEQVLLTEGQLIRGVSIGRIQINRRKES